MPRTLKLFKVTKIGAVSLTDACHLILDGDLGDGDYVKKFAVLNYLCPDAGDFEKAGIWFKKPFANLDKNPQNPPSHEAVHKTWDALLGIKAATAKTDIANVWANKHYHTVLDPTKGSLSREALLIMSQCIKRMNDKNDKTFVFVRDIE
jgi:hypothetical protein